MRLQLMCERDYYITVVRHVPQKKTWFLSDYVVCALSIAMERSYLHDSSWFMIFLFTPIIFFVLYV